MILKNETPLLVGHTMGFAPSGREIVVVVAKGSYPLLRARGDDDPEALAPEPAPLYEADVFGPDPATTATLFESDYAHGKPRCDVLLHGAAHAPEAKQVRSLAVRLSLGAVDKSFRVTGTRVWTGSALTSIGTGIPLPFSSQRISYDVAFGGTDHPPNDPARLDMFLENPVGLGFRSHRLNVQDVPMPLTEEVSAPISDPRKRYRPMAFGPLGRSWQPRIAHAGTYDEAWIDTRAPFWPNDFSPRYFQAAPDDQQTDYPAGGERFELHNLVPVSLSPSASCRATLPGRQVGVGFFGRTGEPAFAKANLDTIVIEPDQNRFSCSWRAVYTVQRDMFELSEIVIGQPESLQSRVRARLKGKTYYPNLGALAADRSRGRRR